MMDLKELRVGNWVEVTRHEVLRDEPKTVQIQIPSELLYQAWGCEGTKAAISPIPISPEWLERFGFGKSEAIQQEWSYVLFAKARVNIVYYKGDTNCCSLFQDDTTIDLAHGQCKYIHQLQNLYFCLTGSELKLTT